ncbi:STAS/SEC14 domain-containing protein [Pyxidicoccus fallax]|nr:STAS/SEC14 domain-containing protein [Pyxidicoccus fallax]
MQQQEWKLGAHVVRYEPPDLVMATFSGPINLEEIQRAVAVYGEAAKHGPYYMIADIGQSQLGAEPRRYLSENGRADWFKGVVYVGADVVQQTFGKVLALAMLFTGKTRFETAFVKTLPEARAWVEQNRIKQRKKHG